MKQCTMLQDGFKAVCDHLDSLKQSDYSKSRYKRAFEDISDYYQNHKVLDYSPVTNAEYREDLLSRYEGGSISKKKYNSFSRLSFMLDSYYAGIPFLSKYSRGNRYKVHLNDFFQAKTDEFEKFLQGKMSTISIPGYISVARDFFYFLQNEGMESIDALYDEIIRKFIISCHEYRSASMNNVCCGVRKILEFIQYEGYTVPTEPVSYKAAPTRRIIYPALDADELTAILDVPNRETTMGKRDYAILLLASFTGLRAIDIANLCFSNYEPEKLTIHICQHKTKNLLGLPIPEEVVAAIDDYINHGRPDSESKYVFLTMDRPYRKLCDISSVRNILLRQLKLSSIGYTPRTGRGFHVFRRTIGKWLLGASVDTEMISQVLGHRDGEVLKRYLPLAPDAMRKCALGFETAPLRSEVFV